jgi:hypothetical protein
VGETLDLSDEPLYCPFCGAEDYECGCDLPHDGDTRPLVYCEACGGKEPCGCEYSNRKTEERTP